MYNFHLSLAALRCNISSGGGTIIRFLLSGGPKGRHAEPHKHIGKKKPMNWFCHGYHGQRYCSWARTHDGDDGGVAQHGGHTPIETCSLGLPCSSLIFIGHRCYEQLTPVKTRYLLTSITWPYRGLKSKTHQGHGFYEVDRWPNAGFGLDRGLMSG